MQPTVAGLGERELERFVECHDVAGVDDELAIDRLRIDRSERVTVVLDPRPIEISMTVAVDVHTSLDDPHELH